MTPSRSARQVLWNLDQVLSRSPKHPHYAFLECGGSAAAFDTLPTPPNQSYPPNIVVIPTEARTNFMRQRKTRLQRSGSASTAPPRQSAFGRHPEERGDEGPLFDSSVIGAASVFVVIPTKPRTPFRGAEGTLFDCGVATTFRFQNPSSLQRTKKSPCL